MLHRIACIVIIAVFLLPLPAGATGAAQIPGLRHHATVFRDVDGIPHIVAKNSHDLFLLQGYVHARDRFFQMDVQRRLASGTLAELLGVGALASDVELRTIGLRRAAERSWAAATPQVRKAVREYTKGVNAYLDMHPLPMEYGYLELETAARWEPVDCMVIAKLLAFGLSFDLQDLNNTEALLTYQGVGAVAGFDGTKLFFEDLYRSAPFDPASTVPDASKKPCIKPGCRYTHCRHGKAGGNSAAYWCGMLDHRTLQSLWAYKDRVSGIPILARALNPKRHCQGSNEWAVSGKLTTTGRSLVANDPHLDLDTPSTFYQMHLMTTRSVKYDVTGSTFPGFPFVVIGQNRYIAWGATVHPMDVTDVYQEIIEADQTSPSGLSTVYMGKLEHIIPIPATFRVNRLDSGIPDDIVTVPAGPDIPPFVLIVPRRNNGPLLKLEDENGPALSLQYTGFSATQEPETFRRWNLARGLKDFIKGLQYFDFGSQNWIYADVYGNIAYFTSGEMPIREDLQAQAVNGLPPYFIRNGTGGNEWLPAKKRQPNQSLPYEILPFKEMPQIINPKCGYIINANNDPIGNTLDNNPLNELRPGGGIFYLNPGYAIGTRAGRITQLMEEKLAAGRVNFADMQEIQADVVMLDAQVFTPSILQAFENATEPGAEPALAALAADPRVVEAVGRLADWDHSTPTGIPQGYDASDVNGALSPPTPEEEAASIAATIYSVWRGRFINNTIDVTVDAYGMPRPRGDRAMTALRNLLDNFAANGGVGASGIDFFFNPLVADPEDRRDIVILQSLIDALDLLASDAFEAAFGNSADQSVYKWGLLHRIVFDHPMGDPFSIPPAGGAFPHPLGEDLLGIPTDGGFGVVDASSHSPRAEAVDDFTFGAGPARRYVGQPMGKWKPIKAETILPGGSSGDLMSPYYFNLLGRWLTNDTYPVRQRLIDIFRALDEVEVFKPKRKR